MRYLITSKRSDVAITLGYDAEGLLCELKVENMPDAEARTWTFRNMPIQEADLSSILARQSLCHQVLNVTFDEFWKKYAYKEGKKDAATAWGRMNETNRQLAYAYIDTYRNACLRDRKHPMYPATYLRAERWLDKT
ncbi:MAG TPA: hypothetical protein PKD45_15235 [Flavobacteriales bacterium]|nr:hypothetical protein [Flavobacteriales bacterium]